MNYNDVSNTPFRKAPSSGKAKKIILWLLGIVALLTVLVILFISFYVGWSMTHPERKALDDSPEAWGLQFEDVTFHSYLDDTELSGWMITGDEEAEGIIIMAHGYKGNRLESDVPALSLTKDLVEHQYHVLLFDFRNSGISAGNKTTVGYEEKEDLITVIREVNQLYPELPIGLQGFSMGATTSIIAAKEEPLVQAIVADSPFADLREYLEVNLPHWSNLPNFPFTPIILNTIPAITGIDLKVVSPREAIKELDIPILLIHGDGDVAIPAHNSEEIHANAQHENVFLWITEGANHVRSYDEHPQLYRENVVTFFDTHLKK